MQEAEPYRGPDPGEFAAHMLTITRRTGPARVASVYFAPHLVAAADADLVQYVQTECERDGFEPWPTRLIDLTADPSRILSGFVSSTRNQINRAEREDGLGFVALDAPSEGDIAHFRTFYNDFARDKGTSVCGPYHLETMRLLRRRNALTITRVTDASGILCYHAYVVGEARAMLLYSASHFRSAETAESRRRVGRANRWLHWKDMNYFRGRGVRTYDCGGLTSDPNIAEFKRSFGGADVTEYSGYVAATWKGALVLRIRNALVRWRARDRSRNEKVKP